MATLDDGRGECLFQLPGDGVPKRMNHLVQGARVEECVAHTLGGTIIGLEPHAAVDDVVGKVYLGMCYVVTPVEERGFPEKRIYYTGLVTLGNIFDAFEPYQLYCPRTVVEGGYEPASCALALRGVGDYAAFELYIGHCACYLGYTICLAAVDVLIGEVVEHIAIGANVELARQKLGTLLSYPGQVLYVHFVKRGHLAATYQRAASRQAPNLAGRLFLCFRGCLR